MAVSYGSVRAARGRAVLLPFILRYQRSVPHWLRLCDVGGRVPARLPARVVVRRLPDLQRPDRSLRAHSRDARPDRRPLHLEHGLRVRSLHARTGYLRTDLLDARRLHAGLLRRALSDRLDLRDLRNRRRLLRRLVRGQQ